MTEDEIAQIAGAYGLCVGGIAEPAPTDLVPQGTQSIVLLAPDTQFWPLFSTSPEAQDKAPDPIDRWSKRTITQIAYAAKGTPIFPFGGPPYAPFYAWALRSGRAWASPVALLVHEAQGLFISYRGAIALPVKIQTDHQPTPQPCTDCAQPCLTACPVGAITQTAYDTATCHAHLATQKGQTCVTKGCQVRGACPVGQGLRSDAQNAFHMAAFTRSA